MRAVDVRDVEPGVGEGRAHGSAREFEWRQSLRIGLESRIVRGADTDDRRRATQQALEVSHLRDRKLQGREALCGSLSCAHPARGHAT